VVRVQEPTDLTKYLGSVRCVRGIEQIVKQMVNAVCVCDLASEHADNSGGARAELRLAYRFHLLAQCLQCCVTQQRVVNFIHSQKPTGGQGHISLLGG